MRILSLLERSENSYEFCYDVFGNAKDPLPVQHTLSLPELRAPRWSIRWRRRAVACRVLELSESLRATSDGGLREMADALRLRHWEGASLESLLPAAFALVRETSRRECKMAHHFEQILGGVVLFDGRVAEMQTGEGKTLTVLLPAFLHSFSGTGCHVVTANEYLAARDAEFARTVLERLGVSVGTVLHRMNSTQRRDAYALDVTYTTAKEIGFDFLRDRLKAAGTDARRRSPIIRDSSAETDREPVHRRFAFAIVDEADSVLIDDARTPLLIATEAPAEPATVALAGWAAETARALAAVTDFEWDAPRRHARLTNQGTRRVLEAVKPAALGTLDVRRIYEQIESALCAEHGFARDRDYVVSDGKVAIVDESTGRVLDGRKWQDGLHQAIEAREGVEITAGTRAAARITVQSLFRRYERLAGLTGTAREAGREFAEAYRLPVVRIPTHKPCRRRALPHRVFATLEAKLTAIAEEARSVASSGRAVLIGTPSVAASETLSRHLELFGIEHSVLNCRHHAREAAIIAQAGQPGRVTLATNMAGRGTDIKTHPDVLSRGGLHVIATERHRSPRIDRQLIGRTGRQGEAGSFRFLLSLDDELIRAAPAAKRERWRRAARPRADGTLAPRWIGVFRAVQRELERRGRSQRKALRENERKHVDLCRRTGLDPFLDASED